jgi:hypothetical protein
VKASSYSGVKTKIQVAIVFALLTIRVEKRASPHILRRSLPSTAGRTISRFSPNSELDGWKLSSTPPGAGAEAASSTLHRVQGREPELSTRSATLGCNQPRHRLMLAAEEMIQFPSLAAVRLNRQAFLECRSRASQSWQTQDYTTPGYLLHRLNALNMLHTSHLVPDILRRCPRRSLLDQVLKSNTIGLGFHASRQDVWDRNTCISSDYATKQAKWTCDGR